MDWVDTYSIWEENKARNSLFAIREVVAGCEEW